MYYTTGPLRDHTRRLLFSTKRGYVIYHSMMQNELNNFRRVANSRRTRKQAGKTLPSGVAPSFAYACPERFGGCNCLQLVDIDLVEDIMKEMKGEFE